MIDAVLIHFSILCLGITLNLIALILTLYLKNVQIWPPPGLDIYDNRLLVSDYANGDIIVYDITPDPVVELGRIETGLSNEIMGLKVSPEGAIWYVCSNANELYQITTLMVGDVNGDGSYNVVDVLLCVQFVMGLADLEEDELNRADVNYDGVIDIFDLLLIVDLVLD